MLKLLGTFLLESPAIGILIAFLIAWALGWFD